MSPNMRKCILGVTFSLMVISLHRGIKDVKILKKITTDNEKLTLTQKEWLDIEQNISTKFKDVMIEVFEKGKIDESRLMETVDSAARTIGGSYSLASPTTETKDFFEIHKIAISFSNAKIEEVLSFDEKIESIQQNLRVEEVNLSSPGNGLISAKFVIGALDINKNKNIKELLAGLTKDEIAQISSYVQINPNIVNENE
ncbi:MAG: hypothetical protein LBH49_00665 [Puniceicoccales bacterium]|jgi:hypothetical protein|nr:hypothetical protein [Puniceicoccales bacterium]